MASLIFFSSLGSVLSGLLRDGVRAVRATLRRRGLAPGGRGLLRRARRLALQRTQHEIVVHRVVRALRFATVGRGAALVLLEGADQRAAHAEHRVGIEVLVA